MRLADKILADGVVLPYASADGNRMVTNVARLTLEASRVVEISNVYEYCHGNQSAVSVYDLPCGAPPNELMFFEWRQHNGKWAGVQAVARDAKTAPFVIGDMVPADEVGANGFRALTGDSSGFPRMWLSDHLPDQAAWDRIRWAWDIELYVGDRSLVQGPLSSQRLALDEWGRLVDITYEMHVAMAEMPELQAMALTPLQIFLTAVNLMQCANIHTVWVDPPAKLSKKHRRRGHIARDLVRYQVLQLKTLGADRKPRSEPSDGPHGLTGFHMVRGEFHHYGNCCPGLHEPKGLYFGRDEGRIWVPGHARGNRERGVVRSDLTVGPVGDDSGLERVLHASAAADRD